MKKYPVDSVSKPVLWLKTNFYLIPIIISSLGLILSIIIDHSGFQKYVYLWQAVFSISILLLINIRERYDADALLKSNPAFFSKFKMKDSEQFIDVSKKAESAYEAIVIYLHGIIFIWLIYYSLKFINTAFYYDNLFTNQFGLILYSFLNNLSSLFVLFLFHILWRPSLWAGGKKPIIFYLGISFCILITLFWLAIRILRPENFKEVEMIFSGLVSFVFFALLCGRMDSKFICTHPFLIIILLIYAAVQLLFPFFLIIEEYYFIYPNTTNNIILFFFLYSFVGKIFFYGFFAWSYYSHRLYIYLVRLIDWNTKLKSDRVMLQEEIRNILLD